MSGRCVVLTFSPTANQISLQILENRVSSSSVKKWLFGDIWISNMIQSLGNENNSIVAMLDPVRSKGIIREYDKNLGQVHNF